LTQTGSYKVIEKERNHFSSIYGKIVDGSGRTVVADADVDMQLLRGGKFIAAPMRYFMRFHEADGMHAGYLPVIRPRMVAYVCRSSSRLPFSTRLKSARPCKCLDEHREIISITATGLNWGVIFSHGSAGQSIRASRPDMIRVSTRDTIHRGDNQQWSNGVVENWSVGQTVQRQYSMTPLLHFSNVEMTAHYLRRKEDAGFEKALAELA
jgi:hypothetical protein